MDLSIQIAIIVDICVRRVPGTWQYMLSGCRVR